MEQRKIQRIVFMPPDKIGNDREEFLLQTLKQNRDKLHSQKDGYIVEILKITDWTNQVSNITGNILFKTNLMVNSIILQKNLEIPVSVTMILAPGILCNYYDIKIWVPIANTNGFKFISNMLIKKKQQIAVGSTINVKISEIRYEKKKFSCIASLVT
tara:strand:- start:151 stop:621 length:471 start_codon:yes stop_codon:yes gene_type:complete